MKKMSVEDKLGLLQHKKNVQPHIKVNEQVCKERCKTKLCTIVCPSKSYELNQNDTVLLHYENCMECGSCRIICPEHNIRWNYPVFGSGIIYRYG